MRRTTFTLLALAVALLVPSMCLSQASLTVSPVLDAPVDGETFHTGPGGNGYAQVAMSGYVTFTMTGISSSVTIFVNTELGVENAGTACTVNGNRLLTPDANGVYTNTVFLGNGQTGYTDVSTPMGTWTAFITGTGYYGSGQPKSNSAPCGIIVVY